MAITAAHKAILEEKRKKDILRAAKKLFYLNGYKGTSLDKIAQEAGISKGLIYHYFKNKMALILALNQSLEGYMEEIRSMDDPYEALTRFGCDLLVNDDRLYEEVPPTQICLLTFSGGELSGQTFKEEKWLYSSFGRVVLGKLFAKGMEKGEFMEGDAARFGDIYWSYLMGKLVALKKGGDTKEPEVYVKEILSLFRR